MSEVALGGTNGQFTSMVAEGGLYGKGLGGVVELCAGSVCVYIIDFFGIELCVGNGSFHGFSGAFSVRERGSDVIAVACCAVAEQFAIYVCTAIAGVLIFFENDDARSF